MAKFRKKPVVIEAQQFDGTPQCANRLCEELKNVYCDAMSGALYCKTLEGTLSVSPDDWIITGVNGEQYPCKPDIFEKTYVPVVRPRSIERVRRWIINPRWMH